MSLSDPSDASALQQRPVASRPSTTARSSSDASRPARARRVGGARSTRRPPPRPQSDASSIEGRPVCKWCGDPIPEVDPDTGRTKRRDAETCSKRCRQASWRFGYHHGPGPVQDLGHPREFAYADPPYPGMAARYYSGHQDFAGEVDHSRLVEQLVDGYPDGWALSTSSKTLREVLALCPEDVRVGAWTKPVPPGYTQRARTAWEPVIFRGGRPLARDSSTVLDWVHAAPPRTIPGQIVGTKPAAFSYWLFDVLGAQPDDELADLFPGSGAVARAWDRYTSRPPEDATDPSPVDVAARR